MSKTSWTLSISIKFDLQILGLGMQFCLRPLLQKFGYKRKSDIYNFTPDIWVLYQLSSTIFINIYILCPTKGNSKIFIYFRIVFFRSGFGPCLVFFESSTRSDGNITHLCSDRFRSGMIGSMVGWQNSEMMRQMHTQWLQSRDSCSDWFCSGVIGSGIGWLNSGTMRQVHL